ncbi:MAG: hypothetical protein ACYDC6_02405 [Acidobacteriaceae bacterium]
MPQHLQVLRSQAILQRLLVALLFWASMSAFAQQKKNSGPLSVLKNADVSAGIFGQFTSRVPGNTQPVAQSTNASAGALFSFHKSYHWWLGYDVNYGHTGFSENYVVTLGAECLTYPGTSKPPTCIPATPANATVPTSMQEFTGAYLVKSPTSLLGLRPYGEAGLGDLLFAPSVNKTEVTFPNSSIYQNYSESISTQNRLAGLYAIGVDAPLLTSHLGVRLEYRGLLYIAPRFGNSFLNSNRPMLTQEPVASLYFKF